METKKDYSVFQRNLNTFMLACCLAISGWVLKSVTELQIALARQQVLTTGDHDSISELIRAQQDQSKIITSIDLRLNRVETIQSEKNK